MLRSYNTYTCSVEVGDIIVILDMDTDPGSSGVPIHLSGPGS